MAQRATRINGYLIEGDHVYVKNRTRPLCDVPIMRSGNKPVDGGNYLFTPDEKAEFIANEPKSQKFFRRWFGSQEFINSIERWCLWLGECNPNRLRAMPHVIKRVQNVRGFRGKSKKAKTREFASQPTRFEVETFADESYLLVPAVSSERRPFAPIGFMDASTIPSNLVNVILDASLYHFGVLCSTMHMAWVRHVAGRLKSDYRYSANLVYNNYPWPPAVSDAKRAAVEKAAQGVLDARDAYPEASLADLYDPLAMPAKLAKAHAKLDRAVDRCYRSQPFPNERNRVEYLFKLYQKLTAPLLPTKKKGGKK